jgi:hypothetical protein
MNFMEHVFGVILRKMEDIKGDRTLSIIRTQRDQDDGYKLVLSDGNNIQIYCRETTYLVSYSKWFIANKQFSVYEVFCVCSENVPQDLKNKLSSTFIVSELLPFLSYKKDQKKAAISAYVDIIISKYNQ